MKKLLFVIAVVLMPALASANFSITFENTSDNKMVYLFYWLDHPFKSFRPANMAAGELGAHKSRGLSSHYKSGKYCVIWKDNDEQMHEMLLDIQDDVEIATGSTVLSNFSLVRHPQSRSSVHASRNP